MTMKKIPIGDASNAQLIEYARTVLSLEVKDGTPSVHVLSKIKAVNPDVEEILISEAVQSIVAAQPAPARNETAIAAAEAAKATGERELGPTHHDDPKVYLTIPKVEGPGGDRDVPVAVNGYQWLLRRDEKLELPYRVFEALQTAWQDLYEQKQATPTSRPEMVQRTVLSYPFFIDMAKMPSPEAIAAYHARTADIFAP